ncbi:MAG: hypothetical protein KJP07_06720 [Desulfatitalea sp.]|nr:hypothetical protein [Desulfatitalea sp.]
MKYVLTLAMLFFLLFGNNACSKCGDQPFESNLDRKLKGMDSKAVIAIVPGKTASMLRLNGEDAKPCSVEPGHTSQKVCPAYRKGAEIISTETVKITQSKGSFCATIENILTHTAYQVCIPPE